jgi:hypothetical protein
MYIRVCPRLNELGILEYVEHTNINRWSKEENVRKRNKETHETSETGSKHLEISPIDVAPEAVVVGYIIKCISNHTSSNF